MRREVFRVYETQSNNGVITSVTPKSFDSESYNNDVEKALRRAKGAFHDALAYACNTDREFTSVMIVQISTNETIDQETVGVFPGTPEPEEE